MRGNTIILNSIAKTMNAGGSAIVAVFDAGAAAFNCTMSALSPGEKSKLRSRIKALEKKIRALYVAIAKETSKYPDPSAALESESVIATLADIKDYNSEIELMKQRIAEIERIKADKKPQQKKQQESAGFAKSFVDSVSGSISGYLPGEKSRLLRKIAEHEKSIQSLYLELAKETAKYPDPSDAIAAESVIGIIAKIKELKAEIATLNQGIVEIAEVKKAEKVKTPAVSPVAEDSPVIKDVDHEATGESIDEQSDGTTIGYARTKSCLIPTPTLQPPTRGDIETATRSLQADANREDLIDGIPLEQVDVASTEASAVAEEVSPQSVDVESVPVDVDEQPEATETAEAASEAEATEAEATEAEATEAEATAVEEEAEAEAEAEATEAEATEAEATEAEVSDLSEEPGTEEIPAPEEEKKSPILIHSTYSGEFSGIRTRMHTTAYPHQTDNSEPDFKPGGNFSDESTQVFRTRVHQNTFSTVALAASEPAAEETVVPIEKKPVVVNKVVAPKHSSEKKPVVINVVAPKHSSEKKTVVNNAVAPKHSSEKKAPAKDNRPKGSGGENFSVKNEVLSSRSRKGSSTKK